MKKTLNRRFNITIVLTIFITFAMFGSMIILGILVYLLRITGIFDSIGMTRANPVVGLFGMLFVNALISSALAGIFTKGTLDPVEKVITATHEVAQGNFDVKVDDIKGLKALVELGDSFNKMTQELSGIETLRGDFINNFSHEFKTPIVSIRGFAKLLIEGDLTDEEKLEYLQIILTESERLAELSTNVLNLSKYEAIEIITEKAPFRIDEQIRRAIVMTEPKWSAKDINMNIGLDEIIFNGNENLTQQIWINLLDNAIKFSGQNGNIGISLMDSGESISFSIQDDGTGMTEETKRHIFDKFYQGDRSHTKSGNGLGLTMVKRIVELHSGTVRIESEIGKGSVFTVVLPK
jgi:signal transduction histidine kinase